ncbi:MAG: 4-hydroxythreonine-4-phosphate dehydrogenase PdxA, partial [Deltaproteobacteria bacterium]|nr:4-hydroxythreonine-4-phosphate dehydrogenase PdxA [Deltaproteobacteria bacterium]
ELKPWQVGEPLPRISSAVPVLSLTNLSTKESRPGRPSRACGEAVYRYISTAVKLILHSDADAMATAPISKKVLQLAGHRYPGHTEMLADMTRTNDFRMMLLGKKLKVVLVTVHLPLAKVSKVITRKNVRVTLELTHKSLRDRFGIPRPRLAVAGLNPHAGEEGIFGHEERRAIHPAIKDVHRKGIRAYGPFAADSVFYQAAQGKYDAVICMYHDQGLGPLKLLHFVDGVNLTLGLPIVRTSADHGTAYDIAGKNKADGSSMTEAILLASKLARGKKGQKR